MEFPMRIDKMLKIAFQKTLNFYSNAKAKILPHFKEHEN
jgi:hypothetical protein